jgi:hypothetical protein
MENKDKIVLILIVGIASVNFYLNYVMQKKIDNIKELLSSK